MAALFTNSNLLDSILNEVEKITRYEKVFSKLSLDDMKMLEETSEFDYDLIGFLCCNNQDILTDKLLRSFIDLEYSIRRNYRENIRHGNNCNTVSYSPHLMKDIEDAVDRVKSIFRNKRLYSDSSLEEKTFVEHFWNIEEIVNREGGFKKDIITVSNTEYLNVLNRIYGKVHDMFMILKCELESKPYLRQTSFVIKYVITICLTISMAHSVVRFE